ncbi:MAG TPA: 50S ribosomal protein L19e [Candidatus Nanoarchaeia archaeon]|nr:50S ribosomal protein L19e [Candidatus Nanoarchaeia archaeon]
MNLKVQRKIAAQILKCGADRVSFNVDKLPEIKEAITKADIRSLIKNGLIIAKKKKGISRFRAKFTIHQRQLGRRRGLGSRKGKKTARTPSKKVWMTKVRTQRDLLVTLKQKNIIAPDSYRNLYRKISGGFFRSRRHIKIFIKENNLTMEKNVKT